MNRRELMLKLLRMQDLKEDAILNRDWNMVKAYDEQVGFIIAKLEKLND